MKRLFAQLLLVIVLVCEALGQQTIDPRLLTPTIPRRITLDGVVVPAGADLTNWALNLQDTATIDVTNPSGQNVQLGVKAGSITDGMLAAGGITTRSKLPSAVGYEDEANTWTLGNTFNGALSIGTTGSFAISGSTSGVITFGRSAAAGTYNFNMPTSPGTSGQPLISGGGGATAQSYGTLGFVGGGTNQTSWVASRCVRVNTAGTALESAGADCGTGAGTPDLTASYAWTGAHSWRDNNFSILDNADPSKIIKFELSGLPTTTTYTYNVPLANTTLLGSNNIGSTVQGYHANLGAISGLTTSANQMTYWTGAGTAALTPLSAFMRTVLDDADAATTRATLGAISLTEANATALPFTPTASIAATTVAGAITETYNESQRLNSTLTSLGNYTAGAVISGTTAYCSDGGSSDTYSCTNPAVVESAGPLTGALYQFRANTVNTGAASINFSIGGAKVIKKFLAGTKVDLATGDIPAGSFPLLTYDGTDMVCLSCAGATGGGGGGLSGTLATNNCLAKEGTGSTDATCSSITDDGAGVVTIGNIAGGSYHVDAFATPTAVHTHTWPAQSGDVMQSIGSRTGGQMLSFNAFGLATEAGVSATMARTKLTQFMIGADDGSALVDTNDQPSIFYNHWGQGITITEVWCETDTGTLTINIQRDDGSPANILSSSLACSNTGASSSTFSGTENQVASTQRIDLALVAITSGAPHRVMVSIKYTLD